MQTTCYQCRRSPRTSTAAPTHARIGLTTLSTRMQKGGPFPSERGGNSPPQGQLPQVGINESMCRRPSAHDYPGAKSEAAPASTAASARGTHTRAPPKTCTLLRTAFRHLSLRLGGGLNHGYAVTEQGQGTGVSMLVEQLAIVTNHG